MEIILMVSVIRDYSCPEWLIPSSKSLCQQLQTGWQSLCIRTWNVIKSMMCAKESKVELNWERHVLFSLGVAAYSGLQWRLSIQWVLRALCLDLDLIFGWKIVFSLLNYNSISNFHFWIWVASWSVKWVFFVVLWVDFDCMCIRETGLVKWHLGKRT